MRKCKPLPSPSTMQGVSLICQLVDNDFNHVGLLFVIVVSTAKYVAKLKPLIQAESPYQNTDGFQLWMPKQPWEIHGEDKGVSAVNKILESLRNEHDQTSAACLLLPSSRL